VEWIGKLLLRNGTAAFQRKPSPELVHLATQALLKHANEFILEPTSTYESNYLLIMKMRKEINNVNDTTIQS